MNELWQKVKEWWSNLSLREKQAVAAGGSLLGIFILYQFIWSPFLDNVASMRKRINSDQKLLVWMEEADKKIKKIEGETKTQGKMISPVVLLGLIQKQINSSGLERSLTNLKQASTNSIELQFQKVEFDKLIKLLTTIIKAHGVTISQMSVTAETAPGIVNAEIVITL